MSEKEIKERIGWLANQCGTEDFRIKELEKDIARRKARRDAMWKESNRLMKKLEEMGVAGREGKETP